MTNGIMTVCRKEMRALYQSPIAFLFVGGFLIASLVAFFTVERFFGRNVADMRPLFDWLPLLLIFLVSAVTMRAWAEERAMGTLELLMTLPVKTHELVLGKFLAAMSLVVIALALTTPLALMVAMLGELDWGPVVGGYVGAILLGAAYTSIGLALSARTNNQLVALMLTAVVGGAFYLVGSPAIVDLTGASTGELLRSLGSGSRFESVARGVVDVRDLVYYGGIAVVALTLNVLTIDRTRLDRTSAKGSKRALHFSLVTGLVAVNVVLANLWLAPVSARIDLTESGQYSLTDTTKDTLRGLDERLSIEGYFSERSHPLLMPLIPQIHDLLREYEIAGRGRVALSFADPNLDEELEARVQEEYGIRAMPFQIADRTQQSVINSFFHIVVRYGDEYEVLSFEDLIEVQVDGTSVDLRLRNLEYDVTRTVRRVSQDFQSLDSMLAGLTEPAELTLYATPDSIPEELAGTYDAIVTAINELTDRSGRLGFEEVDPSANMALQEQLFQSYGVRPMAVDFFGDDTFYLDLVLQSGNRIQRIVPREDSSSGEIRESIESALRRLVPGQLTTVGILSFEPEMPQMDPNIPPQFQPQPTPADYRIVEQALGESAQVRRVSLDSGTVPDDIDVLLIAKPDALDETDLWAIDQYVMRGGAIIVLAGDKTVEVTGDGLESTDADPELAGLLSHWGVQVQPGLVIDPQNAAFPMPRQERRGNMVLQRIEMIDYGLFPDVRSDGFDRAHPALAGIPSLTMPWASALTLTEIEGIESVELLHSSDESWVVPGGQLDPNFEEYPEHGFPYRGENVEKQTLAVALTGRFPSYFADRASPVFDAESSEGSGEGAAQGRTLTESLPGARVAVVGSNEFVSDLIMQLSQRPGGETHRSNLLLLQNLIDWSVSDTDLLQIRNAGSFARTLRPLDEGAAARWELAQYALALALTGALAAIPWLRRRRAVSFATEVSS